MCREPQQGGAQTRIRGAAGLRFEGGNRRLSWPLPAGWGRGRQATADGTHAYAAHAVEFGFRGQGRQDFRCAVTQLGGPGRSIGEQDQAAIADGCQVHVPAQGCGQRTADEVLEFAQASGAGGQLL